MFLTDRKLERRINELEQYRYRDIIPFNNFWAAEEEQGVVNPKRYMERTRPFRMAA